jgi:spore maturation protein CgeB
LTPPRAIGRSRGLGTFLLTDFKENLHTLFAPDREVAVWHSIEDCVVMIERYLRDDLGRKAIASAGRERTISAHTYRNRAQEILRLAACL